MRLATLLLLLFLNALAVAAFAEEAEPPAATTAAAAANAEEGDTPPLDGGKISMTAVIGGVTVPYTIDTGMIPVLDKDGKVLANIFSTSYIMDGGERERPVMFLFNGGPGSSSVALHSGSFGPLYLPGRNLGLEMPEPPYKYVENPHSLLDITDLVFVDPVGTGFSRVEKGEGAEEGMPAEAFWNVKTDIESMVEFIRVWLMEFDRWGAEVYLAGESYGGLRVAGMAGKLSDIGVAPSGVLLISPAISYRDISTGLDNNVTPFVNALPGFAAAAHYHQRLADDLQAKSVDEIRKEVGRWAETELSAGLHAGNRLPPEEKTRLARRISRYTAVPEQEILACDLRLPAEAFSAHLLRDEGRFIGAYDARLTAPGYDWSMEEDPTMALAGEPYQTAFMRFLTETTGDRTLLPYESLSEEVNAAWDFTIGDKGRIGFITTIRSLGLALRRLPFLKVFLAAGRYDLVTPPESALQGLSRMQVPAERLEKGLRVRFYDGGHMMYSNPEALAELSRDVRAWLEK